MTQEQQPLTKVVRLLKCGQCDWVWEPIVDHPRVCPKCKSYDWETKRPTERALREKAE